jgi:hypothetical protein
MPQVPVRQVPEARLQLPEPLELRQVQVLQLQVLHRARLDLPGQPAFFQHRLFWKRI